MPAAALRTCSRAAAAVAAVQRHAHASCPQPSAPYRGHSTAAVALVSRQTFKCSPRPLQTQQLQRWQCRRAFTVAPVHAAEAASASAEQQISSSDADQPHISVLLDEVLAAFEGLSVRTYVDGTLGAAGHASAMLRQHPELETLVGFDLDPTAHQLATDRLSAAGATVVPVAVSAAGTASCGLSPGISSRAPTALLVRSNFGRMKRVLQQLPVGSSSDADHIHDNGSNGASSSTTTGLVGSVDAILLDLGISSMQVDTAERGFSFLRDGPLDMRMDPGAALSAEEAVNTWPEAELGRVLREYGEERNWRGIARRIVAAREETPITTTQQLVKAIGTPGGSFPRGGGRGGKGGRGGDGKFKHPATRTFQALRIAVNGELQSIAQALPDAIDCLAPGGRLAVITFHSLEDRIVKWAFRRAAGMAPSDEQLPSYCLPFEEVQPQASVRILTRRPVVPSEQEQAANARSRSAKLRVVEKL